jgi:NPCBM/NEW2 domain
MNERALAVLFLPGKTCSPCRRVLVVAALSITLCAGGGPRAGAATSGAAVSDPMFKAQLVDGRTVSGRIASLGPGAITLASAEGPAHELPLGRLVKLTREYSVAFPSLDRSHVIFPEGDCLMRGVVGASSETTLDVRSDALGKMAIPLESMLGLYLAGQRSDSELDPIMDRVRGEPRTTEVLWLANGDRLAGGFLGMDENKITMQVGGKPAPVDRAGVVALGFDPGLVVYPRPDSDFLELTLKDGSRLGVTEARLDDSTVLATTRFGQALKVSLNELVRVHVRSKSIDYLSEREPIRVSYVPYVGPTREIRVDRTVDGHYFQLAGQTFDRGLGMQSTTLVAYRLKPGDRRFQALVGVDERAGPLGSVVFRVLVDSNERFRTPPLTDHDSPKAIDVDVAGAKFVILATEFGDRGEVRDLADWVEARIIR